MHISDFFGVLMEIKLQGFADWALLLNHADALLIKKKNFIQDLTKLFRSALNTWSSFLCFLSSWDYKRAPLFLVDTKELLYKNTDKKILKCANVLCYPPPPITGQCILKNYS